MDLTKNEVLLKEANAHLDCWIQHLTPDLTDPDDWWRSFGEDVRLLRSLWFELTPDERVELRASTPIERLVPCELLDFFATEAETARRQTVTSLKNKLAAIVESFDAGSAWLFLRHGKVLIPRVAANAASKMADENYIHIEGEAGIVSHVFNTGRGYLSNCVAADPHYLKWIASTQSEIAVPISIGNTILGVLNVETPAPNAFITSHIAQLNAEASCLLPDIEVILNCEITGSDTIQPSLRGDYCAWHPSTSSWDPTQYFQAICENISRSLMEKSIRRGFLDSEPACTYWYADSIKDVLYSRGTFGFNTEYISSSVLQAKDSRTGETVRGGVIRRMPGDQLSRSRKAKNQGVSHVVMVPLNVGDKSVGAINIYHRTDAQPEVSDIFLRNTALLLSDVVSSQLALRKKLAILEVESSIATDPAFPQDPFGVLLRSLLKVFPADEGSVFLRIDDELICVATTGLIGDLDAPVGISEACYNLRSPKDWGWTAYLASGSARTLRYNDVSNFRDVNPTLPNLAKIRENAARIDPHIRFCGVSIGARPLGVIRLVRRSTSLPFLYEDEQLLLDIATAIEGVFDDYLSAPQQMRRLPSNCVYRPIARRARPAPVNDIRSLLREIVHLFRQTKGTLQASVRTVVGMRQDVSLLTFASYSILHSGISEELESRMHAVTKDNRRSIGWDSICRKAILWFNKAIASEHGWFVPINKDSVRLVASGVCVPFQWVDQDSGFRWGVLSIDSDRSSESGAEWTNNDLRILEDAAKQIGLILGLRDTDVGVLSRSRSSDYDMQQFVLNTCKSVKADWYSLEMGSDQAFPADGFYSASVPTVADWRGELLGNRAHAQEVAFDVGLGGRACRVKLPGICTDAGTLALGNGTVEFVEEFKCQVARIIGSWNTLSYLLSPEWNSSWQPGTESEGIVEFKGGSEGWNPEFMHRLKYAMIPCVPWNDSRRNE